MVDLLVAFVVGQVAVGVAVVLYAVATGATADDLTTEALSIGEIALLQVPLWLGLLVVPLVATRIRGNGAVRDLGLWMRWKDAPTGLAIGVACQFVLVPLVTLPIIELTGSSMEDVEEPARELTDKATGPGVLLLILVVAIGAPIAEEVFYRGMLQRTLGRRLSLWPTIIITSVLFGASHLQPLQFVALASFGAVLSYLAHRTGRLGMSIWAHVGFNLTTVLILLARG